MTDTLENYSSIPITVPDQNSITPQTQQQAEKFIKVCRRYWITFIPIVLLILFLSAAPFALLTALSWFFGDNILLVSGIGPIIVIGMSAYLLCLALFGLIHWIDFYFDVTFITNQRIVDVDQIGVVKRATTAINIIDAREVKASFHSIAENVFNFGAINIQCATKQSIDIEKVKDPKGVAKIINDLHAYLEYERDFDQHHESHSDKEISRVTTPVLPKPIYVDIPQ